MSTYTLGVDLGALADVDAVIAGDLFPRVSQAVSAVAAEAAFRWQDGVMKARLWSGQKTPYLESISWKMDGPLSAMVWTEYAPAKEIETGRPARDLKAVLPTARKARRATTGKHAGQLYLIVPFRHNVPTPSGEGAHAPQMPQAVYALAKQLKASRVLAPGTKKWATRLSSTGHTVAQHSYGWGGRLPSGLVPKLKSHHVTDPMAGMVRFDTSSGKQKSSSYLTFRVLGAWSQGWIVPAQPGLYLARGVAEEMRPVFEDAVGMALKLGG